MLQSFAKSLLSSGGIWLVGSFAVIAVAIYLVIQLIVPAVKQYNRSKKLDEICGSHKRHWFYGHIVDSRHTNRLFQTYELSKKFPKMFNRWLGPLLSEVITYHPDTVLSVLASGAPKTDIARRFFKPWIGDGLLMSSDKKWQRNRRLLTPAFHYKILRPYTKIFNDCSLLMVEKWKSKVGNPVELTKDVSLMTLDSMLQCAMSYKTDCQNIKGDHPYIAAIYDLSSLMTKRFGWPLYFIDWIFYRTEDGKDFLKAADTVHEQAEKIIQKRKEVLSETRSVETTFDSKNNHNFKQRGKNVLDFLDILLQTKDENGVGLSDREIRDEVDTFLFEGHDTTASGISFALHNLAKYPGFQDKCRKEVIEIIGDKKEIEWEDLSKLSYLTMFIKESMRIHPPVPAIGRQHKKPLHFTHGYSPEIKLPSDILSHVNIFSIHRNEEIWENPMVFDPERFNKENISKRSPHAYIPFSAGSRNCIGQNFAMNEMKVVLAQLLLNYQFYLDEETPEPVLHSILILKSKDGLYVKFKPVELDPTSKV